MGGETHLHRSMAAMRPEYPRLADHPVGKQIHSIYQSRLAQFIDGGQYREQGIVS